MNSDIINIIFTINCLSLSICWRYGWAWLKLWHKKSQNENSVDNHTYTHTQTHGGDNHHFISFPYLVSDWTVDSTIQHSLVICCCCLLIFSFSHAMFSVLFHVAFRVYSYCIVFIGVVCIVFIVCISCIFSAYFFSYFWVHYSLALRFAGDIHTRTLKMKWTTTREYTPQKKWQHRHKTIIVECNWGVAYTRIQVTSDDINAYAI